MRSYSLAGGNLLSSVLKVTESKDDPTLAWGSPQSYSQMWKNELFWIISSVSRLHQSHDAWQIISDWIMYSSTLNQVVRVLRQPCLYYLEAELLRRKNYKQTKKSSSKNHHNSYEAQRGRGCARPTQLIHQLLFSLKVVGERIWNASWSEKGWKLQAQ